MSYDPYAEHRRRQAEIQRQESQRLWDRTMRDLHAQSNPTPAAPPGETATGVVGFLLFLVLTPVLWVAGMIWQGDIARPWSRFRKAVGVVGLVGSAVGWTGYWLLSPANQGLAWVLGFVSNLVLVLVVAPRTVLVAGVLVGILGIWVEFFAT